MYAEGSIYFPGNFRCGEAKEVYKEKHLFTQYIAMQYSHQSVNTTMCCKIYQTILFNNYRSHFFNKL